MASTTPASCVMENTAVAPLRKRMNTLAASAQRVTLGCRFLAIPTNTTKVREADQLARAWRDTIRGVVVTPAESPNHHRAFQKVQTQTHRVDTARQSFARNSLAATRC